MPRRPGFLSALTFPLAILTLWSQTECNGQAIHELSSPNGRIRVSLETGGERPEWSAQFDGDSRFEKCALALETRHHGALFEGARLTDTHARSVDESVPVLFGKTDSAHNRFNETRFRFESQSSASIDAVFRVFDDAIAFRYEIPKGQDAERIVITEEATTFQAVGAPTSYVQYLENHRTSHEHLVEDVAFPSIEADRLLDMPLTLSWADGTTAAITEASLRHYAGMSLMRLSKGTQPQALTCRLTPRADGSKVERPLPLSTPWRVVLLSDRPGGLLESNTLYCLNEPPAFDDTSWIDPGKLTFHWWNGDVYDGTPGLRSLSFEMARRYIDFCARNDLPIHSISSTEGVTSPWYHQTKRGVAPGPDTDVTRPRDDFPLERIMDYARSKGVRLWTWAHQAALRGRVEEAFRAFAEIGWSGMMVDFIDHDDQEHIEFTEEILRIAARHKILIHFHGVWKPTGLERTYPNLMNHEGALNLEYLKWSALCTPEHTLRMAFTRLIAGPMDYHLGGFRAVTRDDFEPRNVAPVVLGTRAHMLAMYVCFDNPAPMIADYPTAYEGQPGFDFLQRVPTYWDETRVLQAEIGRLLVTARRHGTTWYIGGLAAGPDRTLSIPLDFLDSETGYAATLWTDGSNAATDPNELQTMKTPWSAGKTLDVTLRKDGGFVMEIQTVD